MSEKGITRKKRGSGKRFTWDYFDPRGKRIANAGEILTRVVKTRANATILQRCTEFLYGIGSASSPPTRSYN
jgi:hypothetical protein